MPAPFQTEEIGRLEQAVIDAKAALTKAILSLIHI